MDNPNFAGIGQLLSMLRDNPQMLSMLMSLMGGAQKPEPKPEPPPAPDPFAALLNMANSHSNAPATPKKSEKGGIFGTKEEMQSRICLLNAVRPYLSEARRERLELIIKLLRLAELGGLSELLKS